MFSYAGMEGFCRFSVKCDPERAVELREKHPEVTRGVHSNSRHWNTVRTDGALPDAFLAEQIRNSYELVVAKLPRAAREELNRLTGAI
jgi:predicted DNA-binding protein (MmcQ/YjbR family)